MRFEEPEQDALLKCAAARILAASQPQRKLNPEAYMFCQSVTGRRERRAGQNLTRTPRWRNADMRISDLA